MTSEEEQICGRASTDPNLGPPLELRLDLEHFLQELATMQVEGRRDYLPQGPPAEDHVDWIEWRGHRVEIPNWWWELVGISGK